VRVKGYGQKKMERAAEVAAVNVLVLPVSDVLEVVSVTVAPKKKPARKRRAVKKRTV